MQLELWEGCWVNPKYVASVADIRENVVVYLQGDNIVHHIRTSTVNAENISQRLNTLERPVPA